MAVNAFAAPRRRTFWKRQGGCLVAQKAFMTQPLGSLARHRPWGNAHRVPRLFERSRQLCLRHHSRHFLRRSQLRPVNGPPEVKAATSFVPNAHAPLVIDYADQVPAGTLLTLPLAPGCQLPQSRQLAADELCGGSVLREAAQIRSIAHSPQTLAPLIAGLAEYGKRRTLCSVHISNQPDQKWASWHAEANAFRHTRTISGSSGFYLPRSSRPGGRLDGFDRSH
jgi:hypothetical protein